MITEPLPVIEGQSPQVLRALGQNVALVKDAKGSTVHIIWHSAAQHAWFLHPYASGWNQARIEWLSDHLGADVGRLLKWVARPPAELPLVEFGSRAAQRAAAAALGLPWKVTPITQKARGMEALKAALTHGYKVPAFAIAQEVDDVPPLTEPRFVRPCPPTPNHGGVESRIVTTRDEAVAVLLEAQAAVPGSEMLICQPIQAKANLVYTPNLLTVGPGHDGATAGKNAKMVGLVRATDLSVLPLEAAKVTEEPFIEAVIDESSEVYWTQLRNGPALPAVADYVPEDTVVRAVVDADGDLLEWAQRVKAFEPGTVVVGSGLGSHYAVHCFQHQVPFMTSRRPAVGETVAKVVAPPLDPVKVREGLILAQRATLSSGKESLTFGLVALHALAMAPELGLNGLAVGYGLGVMIRTAFMLGVGEWRYCKTNGKVTYGDTTVVVSPSPHKGGSRETVYKHYLPKPWLEQRKLAVEATIAFRFGSFTGGYGGQKWHDCMRSTWKMESAARQVIFHPCTDTVNALLGHANVMIHKAHNGGWWFNKVMSHSTLDQAAASDPRLIVEWAAQLWQMLEAHQAAGATLTKSGWPKMKAVPQYILDWKPAEAKPVSTPPPADAPTWPAVSLNVQARLIDGKPEVRLQSRGYLNGMQVWAQEITEGRPEDEREWLGSIVADQPSHANSGVMYVKLVVSPTLGATNIGLSWEGSSLAAPDSFREWVTKRVCTAAHQYFTPTGHKLEKPNATSEADTFYEEEEPWTYV